MLYHLIQPGVYFRCKNLAIAIILRSFREVSVEKDGQHE